MIMKEPRTYIENFNSWSLAENLSFSAGFIDYRPLKILLKIWQNCEKLGLRQKFIGRCVTKGLGVNVKIDDIKTPGNFTNFANAITLSYDTPKKFLDVIYHELVHAVFQEKVVKHGGKFDSLNKRTTLHRSKKRKYSEDITPDYGYFISPNEISSYLGQLYMRAAVLASNPELAAKMKKLLKAGNTSAIFQLDDSHVLSSSRIVSQLYLGGDDKEAIDYINNMDIAKYAKVGILSSLRNGDKLKNKFLKSLWDVLDGANGEELKVLLPGGLYRLLIASGYKDNYINVEEFTESSRNNLPVEDVLNQFLTSLKFMTILSSREEITKWIDDVIADEREFRLLFNVIMISRGEEIEWNSKLSLQENYEKIKTNKDPKDVKEFLINNILEAFQKTSEFGKNIFKP
jgi:hypothetical protein